VVGLFSARKVGAEGVHGADGPWRKISPSKLAGTPSSDAFLPKEVVGVVDRFFVAVPAASLSRGQGGDLEHLAGPFAVARS